MRDGLLWGESMSESHDLRDRNDVAADAQPAHADDLYCPECGYSLRGLTSARCPECGLDLDFIESDVSLIPWERRREFGRFRTYWRTAWLATFRPKRFCRAAYRPVSYRDAQAFRWVSIAHAFVALLLLVGTLEALGGGVSLGEAVEETGWWFVVFVGLCLPLALAAMTGIPSYFFQPRYLPIERQNRAVALSYYASGTLGFVLPIVLLSMPAVWLFAPRPGMNDEYLIIAGLLSGLLQTAIMIFTGWVCWSRLAHHLLRRAGRRLAVTWLMPLVSLLVCGLILLGLPAIAYFVAAVVYSLRGVGLSG